MAHAQEVLANDVEFAFGQQEMNVGDAAVLRILDRDDRARGASVLHRVERVLEGEARQRQAGGRVLERGAVAVAARRALQRHRAGRIGGGGGGHRLDQLQRGGGEAFHAARA